MAFVEISREAVENRGMRGKNGEEVEEVEPSVVEELRKGEVVLLLRV